MKKQTKWLTTVLAVAGGLAMVGSAQAQYTTTVLSDFHNFNLSVLYGNWADPGWDTIDGGAGIMAPVITSGPLTYEVNAGGYGSGAYNFATPVNASGATLFSFTFTINTPTGGPFWMNPGVDISDGTHMVHLTASNADGGFLSYGNYGGVNTYTLVGPLNDQFGGLPLDTSDITAFNLEFDPAGNAPGNIYDITYQNLSLLTPTPEPTTLALIAFGAVGMMAARRRTKA